MFTPTTRNGSRAVPFPDRGPAQLCQGPTESVLGLHCPGPAPQKPNLLNWVLLYVKGSEHALKGRFQSQFFDARNLSALNRNIRHMAGGMSAWNIQLRERLPQKFVVSIADHLAAVFKAKVLDGHTTRISRRLVGTHYCLSFPRVSDFML